MRRPALKLPFALRRRARVRRQRRTCFLVSERLESRQLLAGEPILINFQLAGAPIPAGYLPDTGERFGDRGNGYSYGWNIDHTDVSRDRNANADQRLDTLIHFHERGIWEIALPPNLYDVTVSVGDPSVASTHTINVEGSPFFDALGLGINEFDTETQVVNVIDGRLSLDQGDLPNMSTRINYVEIVPLDGDPNTPPNTPVITEPAVDGQVVNPEDVHMEAPNYSDPDGDPHACTFWSVWTTDASPELAWSTDCLGGVEKVHVHQGDGEFQNAHAGRTSFFSNTDYELRVQYRDNRGALSAPGARLFHTGALTSVFPLVLEDVLDTPAPTFQDELGANATLPAGATPGRLLLESAAGETLLELRGQAGGVQFINPAALAEHVAARVHVIAGSANLALPLTQLRFSDHEGPHTIYLPGLSLAPGEEAFFWISVDGSSYYGNAAQTEPDFTQLARTAPVPYVAAPGYEIDVVAEDFQLPVNIAFVPNPGDEPGDPYYYVTELYGTIKVVTRDGTVADYATNLLNFNPTGDFPGSGEQGLTGIAVDAATGDVFAAYLYSSIPGQEAAPHYPKVVRFHSTDGGLTAATQTTIRDMPGESMGQSHQISNVSFGPDGLLYVHVGDGFDTATAQNLNSYRGKILRMNLDGTAPSDNPFYSALDGITARDYVYAYGFRNPFGGAWRASDGLHYEVENGPSVDRFAQVVEGRNYLWSGSDQSMTNFAIFNWNPATAPTNIAFTQPETFGGSNFPADKMDHAFVAESGPTWGTGPQGNGKRIVEFELDENGNRVIGPTTLVSYSGSGKGSVVGLASGPDGLYFTEMYKDQDYITPIDRGARIFRVRFVGTADFEADVTDGTPNLAVQFTDTSTMPEPTEWLWHFGDGESSTERNPVHVYRAEGNYDVTLRVTGSNGVKTTEKPAFIRVRTTSTPGLLGEYYDNIDLTDLALTRTDAQINFDFGGGSPDPSIGANTFSIRWTGRVVPQFTQTYTFYTVSDDGIRLWVNNQLVVDSWVDQPPTEHSGTISLVAGQEYDLKVEYFENGGGAVAQLSWSSASVPKQIIPAARLTQGTPFNQPPRVLDATGGATEVVFTFHEDVSASLAKGDVTLTHAVNGAVDLTDAVLQYDVVSDTATLTFPSLPGGRLPAGDYTLAMLAAGITDAAGARLDGNADNIGGDNFTLAFSVTATTQPGDTDGDGDVDLEDLNNVRNHFGEIGSGIPGDTNGDNKVDLGDLNEVRNHFGESLEDPVTEALFAELGRSFGARASVNALDRNMRVSGVGLNRLDGAATDALFEANSIVLHPMYPSSARKRR